MRLSVSIIIPNWNGKQLLEKHLHRVVEACAGCEVIIVDDGSTDDSVVFVRSFFPQVTIIQKQTHSGFSSSVNLGVTKSKGDIVVLLNTDVVPQDDFLKPLISHFDEADVFAVGCLEKSIEHGDIVLRGRGLARWHKGFYIHKRGEIDAKDTAWVSGGSGAFRKSYWNTLGGLDELFDPFYWEDIDLSYRAQKSGYRLLFEQSSIVTHYHEIGKIKTRYNDVDVRVVAYRNQCMFIWKNITDTRYLANHCVWLTWRLIQSLLKQDFAFAKGFIAAVARLPRILQLRKSVKRQFIKNDRELI